MSIDEHLPASQPQELTRADCRPLVEIELELDPTVNFAMQQNDVPVVKALRIINRGEAEAADLLVSAWVEPEFAAPWQTRVASVTPEGTYNLKP
jgi:hypothetical protein